MVASQEEYTLCQNFKNPAKIFFKNQRFSNVPIGQTTVPTNSTIRKSNLKR